MPDVAYLFFAIVAPVAIVIIFIHVMSWLAERKERRDKRKEDLEVELHNREVRKEYEERNKRYEDRKKKIDRIGRS